MKLINLPDFLFVLLAPAVILPITILIWSAILWPFVKLYEWAQKKRGK